MRVALARIGFEFHGRGSWPFTTAFALILVSASAMWWWQEHQTSGGETMKLAMQTADGSGRRSRRHRKKYSNKVQRLRRRSW